MSEENRSQYFHGTVSRFRRGDVILPSAVTRRSPTFPADTDTNFAYATADRSNAAAYAEKAWNTQERGVPRVYRVEPLGGVEEDPQYGPDGHRGNYEGDVRSKAGFRVMSEHRLPEFADEDDWR
jgi:rifampin ADP-ribosylating transferase